MVHLKNSFAVVERAAYVAANPVAAGAVRCFNQWPGLCVAPQDLGRRSWTVKRPDYFFHSERWPATATLRLQVPRTDFTDHQLREAVAQEAERLQEQARIRMRESGRRFMGPQAVLQAAPEKRATAPEPRVSRNPSFAVGRHRPGAYRRAVQELRAFRDAYTAALCIWRDGDRDVEFPAGTVQMVLVHAARAAPAPNS